MEQTNIVGLEPTKEQLSLAERKALLLRQGEFYRVGIVHAKAGIKQGSRPEALFHTAVDHAAWAVRSRVDAILHPTGINVATIMPYAVTVLGFLRKRRLVKPALGVLALAGAAAYYLQQRRLRMVH
jgi:hypothetical protein